MLLWIHFWQVGSWPSMILVVQSHSFLWTVRLGAILLMLAKKVFILDTHKRRLIPKIIVYMKNHFLNGYRDVVKTVDTDAITLLLANVSLLNLPYKIDVDFSFGKGRMFYKIKDVCSIILPSNSFHRCFSTVLLVVILHPHFLTYQRVHGGMNGVCQSAYITYAFTKLSWAPHKVV